MEMSIVSLHGRLVPGRPAENARDRLRDGDTKRKNCHDQHNSCRQFKSAIDGKARDHEPKKLGPGVSQKHLRRIVVEDKESQDCTKQRHRIAPMTAMPLNAAKKNIARRISAATPPARPSSPSMRFSAFVIPTIQK